MDSTGRVTLEIIQRIREKPATGIEEFVKHLGPRLLVYAQYKLGDRLRAKLEPEDVIQDIFASIVENRESFLDKVDQRGVHRAIFRMVENRIRDLYEHHFLVEKRSGHREVTAVKSDSGTFRPAVEMDNIAAEQTSISQRIALQDEYRSLQTILQGLPEEAQKLFILKFIQELTNQEIAEELKTSVSTVKRDTAELVKKIQRVRASRQKSDR